MVLGRSLHHALDRDPILRAISSYYGITTLDGNIGGTTLICAALAGSNDFITDKAILLESGLAIYEDAGAIGFDPATGTITVNPAFGSRVLAGTAFYVLNTISPAAILAIIGATGFNQGLCYYGVVTAAAAPQFTIPTLAGLGANKFIDTGLVNQYYAFVLRDASGPGAPPQGESRPITGYATLTGVFVVNPDFTAPVAPSDEMLIMHPFLARIMNLAGRPGTTGSTASTWGDGAAHDLVTLGAANTYNKLHLLVVDITNLVGTITIRLYTSVSGADRQIFPPKVTTWNVAAGDAPGVAVVNGTIGLRNTLRVTVQSDNAADNAKAVPFEYLLEAM